ncbi:MAG: cadmium-translocating P-type ATPase [Bryobacteraceae bacterium]|nr:cadmium-translocating P-type ATPase [Bryobacteraceae bacterium]
MIKQVDFRVSNLDCEHDAATIERGLREFPGLTALKVYPKAARVALTYDPAHTSPDQISGKLRTLGFPPQQGRQIASPPRPWRNPKVLASVASGILLGAGWLLGRTAGSDQISFVIYLAAILIGGYHFGREAIEELIFERQVGIEFLMATAAIAATALGAAGEGAMLVFLYSISEAAEGYTEEKTRSAIRALMELAPKTALVRREGREIEIPAEELVVGDVFIVKPGQAIATDGEVLTGASSVNQAPVTGESVPVEKQPGDTVFAGSINEEGALEVRATRTFAENTISRIISMVEEAQERKGKSQRFIERFGSRYSPAVLLVGILIAIVPPLAGLGGWTMWISRAVVFVVAAAPCALVISIPITLVAALGTGARHGVLIKGGIHVEELAKVRVVAMDKTGTITRGKPEVTDFIPLTGADEVRDNELLAVAAGIENRSQHPLARAIVQYAASRGIQQAEVVDFRSLTAAGAVARYENGLIYIGSPHLFASQLGHSLDEVEPEITRLQSEGKTVVLIGTDKAVWGMFAIRDNVRPNARAAIAALHKSGVQKIVMLTGDNRRTAEAIAREVGIDEVYSDLKPEDKLRIVRDLTSREGHVAMVGDGVNDAPALAEATVGVAMGAAGTDVALETADVALMADDLEKLVYAFQLAQRNQKLVRQNLTLSVVVISVLVIGAVLGAFTLPIAVLGHEISEFVVIGNGLRMLKT